MKKILLVFALIAAFAAMASAATQVTYTASNDPAANPDANSNTVDVWTVSTTTGNTSQAGSFLGDSGSNGDGNGAGAGTSAWGLYANTGQTTTATATFAGGNLLVGQTVSLQFDNGFIDPGGKVGINLLSGANVSFSLSFTGGGSNYTYADAGPGGTARSGFTDDGFTFSLTLTSTTAYTASVTGGNTWSGTIAPGGLSGIQFFDQFAGSGGAANVFANNLAIIPEPSAALGTVALLAGAMGIFVFRRRAAARA
jgi:hypothetical protein